jgi:hypothetical protein
MVTPTHQISVQAIPTHVDRPEVSEAFADSLISCVQANGVVRLEFAVTRVDQPKPGVQPQIRSQTSSRIAIPIPGVIAMAAQLNNLLSGLQQQGILHVPQASGPGQKLN